MSIDTNPKRMSEAGHKWLKTEEGIKRRAYKDTADVDVDGTKGWWTIGVGHLITEAEKSDYLVKSGNTWVPGKTLTNEEVDVLFEKDLVQYETAVYSGVNVAITQTQFDALVAFCFNIGITGFKNSVLLKNLNAGKSVKIGFANWKGKTTGSKLRRVIESTLFHDGKYVDRFPLSLLTPEQQQILYNKYLA